MTKLFPYLIIFVVLTACNFRTTEEKTENKTTVSYRIESLGAPAQVGYGNYYDCLAWESNTDKTQPDTIRLLLLNHEYIDLIDKTELITTFQYKGIHDSEKQPIINGFMTKNREIWEVAELKKKLVAIVNDTN